MPVKPSLFYQDTGTGPVVVLLHGFLENHTMWQGLIGGLPNYRFITPDLPGHGQSPVFGRIQPMPLMADAVIALLDKLDVEKAVFIGHSMGGYVACEMLNRYADRVKGVCLFHSTATDDDAKKKLDRDRAVTVVQRSPMVFIREATPNLFYAPNRPRLKAAIDKLIEEAANMPAEGITASLLGMKERTDHTQLILDAQVPVRYIIGAQDPVIDTRKVMEQVVGTTTTHTVLKGVGHMGFLEDPEKVNVSLMEFLNRCC